MTRRLGGRAPVDRWRRGAVYAACMLATAAAGAEPVAGAQPAAVPAALPQERPLEPPMTVEGDTPPTGRLPRLAGPWRLQIDAPGDLADLLEQYLDLARFEREYGEAAAKEAAQDAAKETAAAKGAPPAGGAGLADAASGAGVASASRAAGDAPTGNGPERADASPSAASSDSPELAPITLGELRRLVAAAPAQARELLQTEGYFDAQVTASLDAQASPRLARIVVEPGPRTRVGAVHVSAGGPLGEAARQGDARAAALEQRLRTEWGLPTGRPFRQADWSAAKNAGMTLLRAEGYPAARWSATAATVDAERHTAELALMADSGPLFHFGAVTIEGLGYQRAQPLLHAAPFERGTPYSDKLLYDYQERLQKLNLFESVSVVMDPDPAQAAAAPVTVRVKELPRQQAVFGIGISANTGPRVSVEHTNRQLMGWDWQARTKLELGRDLNTLQSDLISHPRADGYRHLLAASVNRLEVDGTTTTSESLRVGRTREVERVERTQYLEWQRAESRSDGERSAASALTANVRYVWRDVDSVLLPTRGYIFSGELGAGRSFAADASDGVFGRALARLTGYLALPGNWFTQARVEAGHVQAQPEVGVPDTLLFRAGGDDSVRGYRFRSIGPQRNGLDVGARSLVTSSVEVARPISPRRPALLWAVFADAGDAADAFGDMRMKVGYGVGLRWRSPVGPLRLDLAYGEADKRVRLHFSVGVAL